MGQARLQQHESHIKPELVVFDALQMPNYPACSCIAGVEMMNYGRSILNKYNPMRLI